MMTFAELEKKYNDTLHAAIEMDEAGALAQKANKFPVASQKYTEASALYAQAASIMLDISEMCTLADAQEMQKSVDRLIDIARELKSMAADLAENRVPDPPKPDPALKAQEDDDSPIFIPSEIPEESFDDIAGLEGAKQTVMRTIINPVLHPDLYDRFHIHKSGGLLLFGPPGGGKTMMARAIAHHANLPFFAIRCSDIVGKFFGEAEKRVKALFAAAREAARQHGGVLIFLDEAESLACRRGSNSTVMNRLVPELLSQMDGFEKFDGHVIVIFATNRPGDLDPAFLRHGRLAHHVYVPLPDVEVRRALLTSRLGEIPCLGEIDIETLAQATERFSCADLVQLIDSSCMPAIERGIDLKATGVKTPEVFLTQEDLNLTLPTRHPSVEPAEIARLEKWMKNYGMTIPQPNCA